jgi:hypothetical protein
MTIFIKTAPRLSRLEPICRVARAARGEGRAASEKRGSARQKCVHAFSKEAS